MLAQGVEDVSEWLDLVYWTNEKDAQEAARVIESDTASRPFLDAIGFSFTYSRIELSQEFNRGGRED